MNPLTNIKNIQKLNERELQMGVSGTASWHNQYKDSAWIFVGGLPYTLSEGDVITVFSQYGEIVNVNLVRDKKTGKSKGFCFICYEDQRSTILAVDNLNSIQILKRTIRVDHVLEYKVPKEYDDDDEITKQLKHEGCAPKQESESEESIEEIVDTKPIVKAKKKKSKKKKKKKSKKKNRSDSSESSSEEDIKVKVEIDDGSYSRYEFNKEDGRKYSNGTSANFKDDKKEIKHWKTRGKRSRSRSFDRSNRGQDQSRENNNHRNRGPSQRNRSKSRDKISKQRSRSRDRFRRDRSRSRDRRSRTDMSR